jgi:hypothetical protein
MLDGKYMGGIEGVQSTEFLYNKRCEDIESVEVCGFY